MEILWFQTWGLFHCVVSVWYEVIYPQFILWHDMCGWVVWPKGMSHSCVVPGVCVCAHTVDSRFAGCMQQQRKQRKLRGESQIQVITLTFNSNDALDKSWYLLALRHIHTCTHTCNIYKTKAQKCIHKKLSTILNTVKPELKIPTQGHWVGECRERRNGLKKITVKRTLPFTLMPLLTGGKW